MQILISYGTRPEYIKLRPLIAQLKNVIPYKLLRIGQHMDLIHRSSVDWVLTVDGDPNRLDSIVRAVLNKESIFKDITHVMVQGDTTSAFAVALAAFHRQIPIIHLEAGLRTYQNTPYPEEFNRTAISKMATVHLCPTKHNWSNLMRDGIATPHMYITGNTVLDNIKNIKTVYGKTVIVTMHRRENLEQLPAYFIAISKLAEENNDLKFILPLHPNPGVQKCKKYLHNVHIVDPLPYEKFIKELANCRFVITDSGGLQEEASFFCKATIVCREFTERPETLGTSSFLCRSPDELPRLFEMIKQKGQLIKTKSPYGDGNAAKKIRTILEKLCK